MTDQQYVDSPYYDYQEDHTVQYSISYENDTAPLLKEWGFNQLIPHFASMFKQHEYLFIFTKLSFLFQSKILPSTLLLKS